jgi:DNA-binding GntR family transcriptional regulator
MTLYSDIANKLTREIFVGALKPGQKLVVAELEKAFGVSSMPIRAAIQELRAVGLVVGEPNHGVRVRAVDAEYIENAFDLRIAILDLIFRRCVRFITNADIELIEQIQDEMEESVRQSKLDLARECNLRFHRKVHETARNPEAAAVVERNWILIDALRSQYGYTPERLEQVNRSHRAIIEALKRRDADAAFESQRRSSKQARDELIEMVRREAE